MSSIRPPLLPSRPKRTDKDWQDIARVVNTHDHDIASYPDAGTIADTDYVILEQGGITVKVDFATFAQAVQNWTP